MPPVVPRMQVQHERRHSRRCHVPHEEQARLQWCGAATDPPAAHGPEAGVRGPSGAGRTAVDGALTPSEFDSAMTSSSRSNRWRLLVAELLGPRSQVL